MKKRKFFIWCLKNFFINLKKEINSINEYVFILIVGLELGFIRLVKLLPKSQQVSLIPLILANLVIILGWIINAVINTILDYSFFKILISDMKNDQNESSRDK